MLKVFAAKWCSHCTLTVGYLNSHNIKFEYIEIEEQPKTVVQKIIDINGGDDWVVPTLEYNGRWRKGKVFNKSELEEDLKQLMQ